MTLTGGGNRGNVRVEDQKRAGATGIVVVAKLAPSIQTHPPQGTILLDEKRIVLARGDGGNSIFNNLNSPPFRYRPQLRINHLHIFMPWEPEFDEPLLIESFCRFFQ